MKTSKILIRPFVPALKNEEIEGREPFAILQFGNVKIELDYTLMRYIKIDNNSDLFAKTNSIAARAFDEIMKEMEFATSGNLPRHHRDTEEFKRLPMTHNPLDEFSNKENIKRGDDAF